MEQPDKHHNDDDDHTNNLEALFAGPVLELLLVSRRRSTVTVLLVGVEQAVAPVDANRNGNDGVDRQGNTVALHEGPDSANSSDQTREML